MSLVAFYWLPSFFILHYIGYLLYKINAIPNAFKEMNHRSYALYAELLH